MSIARALVLHPHPSYGGGPSNPPVVAIAGALDVPARRPLLHVAHPVDDVRGELDGWELAGDVLAAGWSFGADTCIASAAIDHRIIALALVAPTFRFCTDDDVDAVLARRLPILVLEPEHDQVTAAGIAASRLPHAVIDVLHGCDHYLAGFEEDVATRVAAFSRELR